MNEREEFDVANDRARFMERITAVLPFLQWGAGVGVALYFVNRLLEEMTKWGS